jgi:crotonobetainyl-CoA:carnitine CoA-transferase CaiB-like acyl-CoA transferase
MSLLVGFKVAQVGPGLAAAVCGRLMADFGATVACIDTQPTNEHEPIVRSLEPLKVFLNQGKQSASHEVLAEADLLVCEGSPNTLRERGQTLEQLRAHNPRATIVLISPYGQTGVMANAPASDLTLFFSSGISQFLTGQVDDLSEAPIYPVGHQSIFLAGIAAACAGMFAVQTKDPAAFVDISMQEVLATLAISELACAGLGLPNRPRKRLTDGNGATVCILQASDGYVAISPREEKQWLAWLQAMGSPRWGHEARFARKADRVANWDALFAKMSEWSVNYDKKTIAELAQTAHVPSFPLCELVEHFSLEQLKYRDFFKKIEIAGEACRVPGSAFGLTLRQGTSVASQALAAKPLAGFRVLDFSWVIAGPTVTRTLAAMGAEVIKVEAPGAGDPGRTSTLHTVLGQGKKGVVLDLKTAAGLAAAKELVKQSDILVENFATGVMAKLGLGPDVLQQLNPDLIYVCACGAGRTGPDAKLVAYGTLLQSFSGFAGLNRHPDRPPRVGFAWLDPMCGLMIAFGVAAAVWQRRRSGLVANIDFSMIEAMLWTLAQPLIAAQIDAPPQPQGDGSSDYSPHGAWACRGEDEWISIAVTSESQWLSLCQLINGLSAFSGHNLKARQSVALVIRGVLTQWASGRTRLEAQDLLLRAGVPAAALATSKNLADSVHLKERGFWEKSGAGTLPGMPWRSSLERVHGQAPGLGEHTESVLCSVLGLTPESVKHWREQGAFG